MTLVLRDARLEDHEALRQMNNAAVPGVNELSAEKWARQLPLLSWFRVAEDEAGLAGFVWCMPSGGTYWSENYRWFAERYPSYLYLDRVVVAERARGKGVGAALYADLHTHAAGRWPVVALEVNLAPPNPGSVRFHERLGYERVGERTYGERGEFAVAMYVHTLKAEG